MELCDAVASAWEWKGLVPERIVDQNDFGNVIVAACDGQYWRICPEELDCAPIAENRAQYERVRADPQFDLDWLSIKFVEAAKAKLGALPVGRCYCLKIPTVLGGSYTPDNFGINLRTELILFAGDLAKQPVLPKSDRGDA